MSNALVVSVTDELVAELEALSYRNHDYVPVKPDAMKALLAERAELKMDAERYRWLCNGNGYFMEENMLCHLSNDKSEADAAIDAAMQS